MTMPLIPTISVKELKEVKDLIEKTFEECDESCYRRDKAEAIYDTIRWVFENHTPPIED